MSQHTSFTRRGRYISALAATGALVVLAGCSGSTSGGDDDTASADVEPATSLTMVVPAAGEAETAYEQIAAVYTEQTGVEFDVKTFPPDSYDSTVRTELQAGTASDIIGTTPGQALPTSAITLAEAGLLAPLPASTADTFAPGSEHLFTLDGEIYAQPSGLAVYGLITSEASYAAQNTSVPETFDELIATCQSLDQPPTLLALPGASWSANSVLALELSASAVYADEPDWNEQRAAGEVTFADTPGWTTVLESVQAMAEAGCFQAGAEGASMEPVIGGLMSGQALSAAFPSVLVKTLAGVNPEASFVVDALPATDPGSRNVIAGQGFGFAINANADASVKAAGELFLAWLAEPENSAHFSELDLSIPVAALEDPTLIPDIFAPVADDLAAGAFTYFPSNDWNNPEVSQALGTGVQGLLTGQTDVATVLQAMDAAWDK